MISKKTVLLILSGLIVAFLMAARPAAAGTGNQASFVRIDTMTQGNWTGIYGSDGYVIPNTTTNKVPSYVTLTPQNEALYTWTSYGTEIRDLLVPGGGARQASCWYTAPGSSSFELDVNISDGNTHQIALYALDWDERSRAETIQVLDGATGAVLDARSLSNFTNGLYAVWNISGHVTFNVILTGGLNAVIGGAFFDPVLSGSGSATAQFIKTDTSTEGNWQGAYGGDGSEIVGVTPSLPGYASVTPENNQTWTWAANSTDPRALQSGSGSRIAATWYTADGTSMFSIDVNTTDGETHEVALYAVDWDSLGRAETIQVMDAQTKVILDSRSISGFVNGIYMVWNISGHVIINVTNTGGKNAVISGVFFGAGSSASAGSPSAPSGTSASGSSSGTTTPSSSGNSNSGSSTAALPSGLVLHWTFDTANISGSTVEDTSNHGGTGVMGGNPAVVNGVINQALSFNGVNSYVTMSNYSDVAAGFNNSTTLSVWIKTTNATRTEAIISKFNAGGSAAGYIFQTDASGHLEFRVGAADIYAYPATVVDTGTINDGQWHHAAVVVTMGQGAQFYVDGVPTSSSAMSIWAGGDAGSALNVGACSYSPYAQYFTGSIDDVQVYNRALSAAEISAIFSNAGQVVSTSSGSGSTGSSSTGSGSGSGSTGSGSGSTSTGSSGSSNPTPPTPPVSSTINAVAFNGIDSTTQGAWKGLGNFNAPPASSSLVYGKDGVILPDTEGCDLACNPFPSYVSFGPKLVNSSTPGNVGSKPNSTHAYVDLVQGPAGVMGAEPQNTSNTNYFQCNYTYSNPAVPWAPMVAWRPVTDTREISLWYTCSGIQSFYLEFSFGNSTHNFEVYVVDDQNGGTQLRSEQIQVLDGDTDAVLYDSGSFTNFTQGLYYKWSVTGHVKVKVINTSTNGTSAVINGVFFN